MDSGTGAEPDRDHATEGGGSPRDYRLGYESVEREHDGVVPPVEGSIPPWLTGTFYRNGPGRFEVGDRSVDHWFDGLALLRRFAFAPGDDGQGGRDEDRDGDEAGGDGPAVEYASRFLRTEAFEAAAAGRIGAQGFAETPDRGPFERLRSALSLEPTDNANADVARLGGRHVALTESPRAVAFDPRTLETRGELDWADDLPPGHTTPHLRRDPDRGETLGYLTTFFPEASYRVFRIPDGELRRETVATVPVENPAYMHSFAHTPEYVVLTEQPFVLPPLKLLSPRRESLVRRFEWRPQQLTRFLVVERATGEVAAQRRVPPFVTFHHANAHRDGDDLVVDLVAFDSPSVLNGMYLDRLRSAPASRGGGGELRRYRIPLSGGDPTVETVAEELAMPRIREDRAGRPYRYVYAQHTAGEGPPGGVAKVDVEAGERSVWQAAGYPSEPVFVPRPDGDGPDDGVVLVESLLPEEGRSALVVVDAADMAERARVPLPGAIPFGFHGQYVADGAP